MHHHIHHYTSLYITIHHYAPLYIIAIHHHTSLYITIHHYTSLYIIAIHHYTLLYITIHNRSTSPHITIHHYTSPLCIQYIIFSHLQKFNVRELERTGRLVLRDTPGCRLLLWLRLPRESHNLFDTAREKHRVLRIIHVLQTSELQPHMRMHRVRA